MNFYFYLLVMALTTYLIRVLPLTLFHGKIKSRYLRSFLAYVPTACLTAMTLPAILFATSSVWSGVAALGVAVLLAFLKQRLVTVAAGCCVAVFFVEWLLTLL